MSQADSYNETLIGNRTWPI